MPEEGRSDPHWHRTLVGKTPVIAASPIPFLGAHSATAGGNPIGRGHNFLEYGRWDEIGSVDKIYDMKYVFILGVSEEMRRVSGPQRSFISSSTPE